MRHYFYTFELRNEDTGLVVGEGSGTVADTNGSQAYKEALKGIKEKSEKKVGKVTVTLIRFNKL